MKKNWSYYLGTDVDWSTTSLEKINSAIEKYPYSAVLHNIKANFLKRHVGKTDQDQLAQMKEQMAIINADSGHWDNFLKERNFGREIILSNEDDQFAEEGMSIEFAENIDHPAQHATESLLDETSGEPSMQEEGNEFVTDKIETSKEDDDNKVLVKDGPSKSKKKTDKLKKLARKRQKRLKKIVAHVEEKPEKKPKKKKKKVKPIVKKMENANIDFAHWLLKLQENEALEKAPKSKKGKKSKRKSENRDKNYVVESLSLKDDTVTEAYVELLVVQGKKKKAKKMYKKLQLKFPEKSNYFAAKIKDLKK